MAAQMEQDKRNTWGPRAVGSLLPGLVRPAFRRRSPVSAQLMADWPAIVGPALAAVTEPRRLSGTALTLACVGPVAMELQHMTAELLSRINGHLGRVAVERLRFTQDVSREAAPPPPPPAPVPATVPDVPPGKLGDALARLAAAMAANTPALTKE